MLNDSGEGRRMTIEIFSWSISTKVWDRAGIELTTPGSAVRHASVARHVSDCAALFGFKLIDSSCKQVLSIKVDNSVDPHQMALQAFRFMVGLGHCPMMKYEIWPITFQGSEPIRPILFSCVKILTLIKIFILQRVYELQKTESTCRLSIQ